MHAPVCADYASFSPDRRRQKHKSSLRCSTMALMHFCRACAPSKPAAQIDLIWVRKLGFLIAGLWDDFRLLQSSTIMADLAEVGSDALADDLPIYRRSILPTLFAQKRAAAADLRNSPRRYQAC
jgi:hypothetical protein